MDYLIKSGKLKNLYVSEAFEQKKYSDLLEHKEFLLKNFFDDKNKKYKNNILQGILSIDEQFTKEYSKQINIFYNKYNKLSPEKREEIVLDKQIFENNDLINLINLLNLINSL